MQRGRSLFLQAFTWAGLSSSREDMSVNRPPSAFSDLPTLQRALEIARSNEYSTLETNVRDHLENALAEIWQRIRADPDGYLLTREEFAVFNFYQLSWEGDDLGRAACHRYWDSFGQPPADGV
ncbi:MAG: hypothetical protein M1815_003649 [Lichina confinis]|nr:MAG: hypothetical protein M1815_003649 [Lichina confinis]